MAIYTIQNGAMQTTAAPVKVTTGTAVKTLLQLVLKSGILGRIIEWGISFDGSAAATPIECELIETGTVTATVTAFAQADFTRVDGDALLVGDPTVGYVSVSTTASGYTASIEGTITAVRNLDGAQLVAPTNQYVKQFPLGQEPVMQAGDSVRIRVTAGAAVNAYCYIKFQV